MVSRLHQPIFAPLLANQKMCLGLLGLSAGHLTLSFFGLPGFPCPYLEVLGVPCLGCGLSRAMLLFVQGEWSKSFQYHLFAPFFLAGFFVLTFVTLLPTSKRFTLIQWVEKGEQKTGVTTLFLISTVIYWLVRLTLWPDEFIHLILFNR